MSNEKWLKDNMILNCIVGSRAYGTNTESSDWDYKGIVIPPIEYHLGLKTFNQFNHSTGGNEKNTKDDIDTEIIAINKFIFECLRGSPTFIEMLFLRKEDYIFMSELGQLLLDNKELFLTRNLAKRFGGFARSQKKRLTQSKRRFNPSVGYDTKALMHAVRIYETVIESMESGRFSTYRNNGEKLRQLNEGSLELAEAESLLQTMGERLIEAEKNSELPATINHDAINNLLIEINLKGLKLSQK